MTAVWILLGILAFFAVLLSFSMTIYVKITEEVTVWLGVFGYRCRLDFDQDKPPKKKKSPKIKEAKLEDAKKKVKSKKATEKSLSETLDFAVTLIKSIFSNSVQMLKHIRITGLRLYMTVACDSADETAITYGAMTMAIYTLLGVLDQTFKLKIKSMDIVPDFVTGEPKYDIYFKVKLRFCHMIFAAFGILFKIITNTIKYSNTKTDKARQAKLNK